MPPATPSAMRTRSLLGGGDRLRGSGFGPVPLVDVPLGDLLKGNHGRLERLAVYARKRPALQLFGAERREHHEAILVLNVLGNPEHASLLGPVSPGPETYRGSP